MSGGKRYKFQGSTIAVLASFTAGSPVSSISAVTKANPAVVTAVGHDLKTGDVVQFAAVGGMTELNGGTYIIEVLSSSTFSLLDTDSTAYGTYTSGGTYTVGVFSNFCELTGYDRTGATSPTIPATTVCSTAEEYEVGLPGSGTTKVDYNFAPQTTIQLALAALDVSKDITGIKIVLPGVGGSRVQLGFVQQLGEKASVGGLWTASLTILNTGPYFDYATP